MKETTDGASSPAAGTGSPALPEKRRWRCLSGYALKYFAMFFMLCDHAAELVIRKGLYAPYTRAVVGGSVLDFSGGPTWLAGVEQVYRVMDVLGHAAFPIFVFLLTEGFAHTRSRRRYLLTLLAFAVISEPVYDFVHYGAAWDFRLQNVLFTLSVCCAQLWALAAIETRWGGRPKMRWALSAAAVAGAAALAFAVRGEYVFLGTASAALFYLLRDKGLWRLAGLAPLLIASPWTALSAPLLLAYSGQRGRRGSKYFFYVFYPAHFLVLMGIGALCAGG